MNNPKTIKLSAFVFLLLSSFLFSPAFSQEYIASENIYGTWTGTGDFNNTKIKAEVGDIEFKITVNEDNTVSGTIGDATIIDSKIIRHVTTKGKDGNTLKCKLEGKINDDAKLKRKTMKIIMYVGEKNEVNTNFYYGGRVGGVTLTKE